MSARYERRVVLVANSYIYVPPPFSAELIMVGRELDAADDFIAQQVSPGDVVVTADIPLASRCLERGARVLEPRGSEWTNDSIGDALAARDLNSYLRDTGMLAGGGRPFSDRDRSNFRSKLDAVLRPG